MNDEVKTTVDEQASAGDAPRVAIIVVDGGHWLNANRIVSEG